MLILRTQGGLDTRQTCDLPGVSEGNLHVLHRGRLAMRGDLDAVLREDEGRPAIRVVDL